MLGQTVAEILSNLAHRAIMCPIQVLTRRVYFLSKQSIGNAGRSASLQFGSRTVPDTLNYHEVRA
jgi:hypothetical protein